MHEQDIADDNKAAVASVTQCQSETKPRNPKQGSVPFKKDSRHSWIVCIACSVTYSLTVGFIYSIGVYYVTFLEVFEQSAGVTAWISSLNMGMLCLVGR